MSVTLEERLAAYGTVLDRAMADDLADRSHETTSDPTRRPPRTRQLVVAIVVVAIAGIAAIAIAASNGQSRGTGQLRHANQPTGPILERLEQEHWHTESRASSLR